jgi:hypothetical protein
MIPKLVYVLNGIEKTHTFTLDGHSTFEQNWEAEEVEYKNPFTREKHWKRWGYYYKATIHYEALEYLTLDLDIRDFFNKNITSRKFYPSGDNPNEYYDVDVNDGISAGDAAVAMAYTDVDVVFRGTVCYPTPLNHPVGYWGDRRHSFRLSIAPDNDPLGLGDQTFAELSGA